MAIVVFEDTYLAVVEVFIVYNETDDGDRQFPVMEDIRLHSAPW